MCARLLAQRWTPGLLCWLGAAHSKGCGGGTHRGRAGAFSAWGRDRDRGREAGVGRGAQGVMGPCGWGPARARVVQVGGGQTAKSWEPFGLCPQGKVGEVSALSTDTASHTSK